ncbi:hypothetical protein AYI70_g8580, partial [Smittium culicis]
MIHRPHQRTDEGPDELLALPTTMTNEKPIKRARNTFSDVLKGNLPHGTPK